MAETAEKSTKKKGWWAGLSNPVKWAIYILTGGIFIYLIYWLFFSGKAFSYEWADGANYGGKNVFAARAKDGTFKQKKGDKVTVKADSAAGDATKKLDGEHEVIDVKEDGKVLILDGIWFTEPNATGSLS